ncbi:LPXTG cell wall anchor domain-containing protein [Bifidobacterium myosotis]|uniref:LPXTG cell wall anchor domain-containing protein n=2 Tax=Bifidobacterium myosotis TaxID=1630166 RepID=A0A5M9ZPS6_9BIFI|nr:LPXTG cell wall anchor domain-containing protein [Bifidobacterium myosotis]
MSDMNPRTITRTLAAIAATATALAGMLVIGGTAQAVDPVPTCTAKPDGTTITLTAENADQFRVDGNTLRAYKLVKLADYKTNADGTYAGLETRLNDWTSPVLGEADNDSDNDLQGLTKWYIAAWALKQNADTFGKGFEYNQGFDHEDPMQWVSEHLLSDPVNGLSEVRHFVDAIDSQVKFDPDKTGENTVTIPEYVARADAKINDPHPQTGGLVNEIGPTKTLEFSVDKPGMYLVYDTSGTRTVNGVKYQASPTILIGTKLSQPTDGSCTPISNADGVVNVKSGSEKVPTGSFQFTKTGRDGKSLAGAKFVIAQKQQDGSYKFGTLEGTAWTFGKDKATDPGVTRVTSDDNGIVKFDNLPIGTFDYRIVEVLAPSGYQNIGVTFDVTITVAEDGTTTYEAAPGTEFAKYVTGTSEDQDPAFEADVKVENIPNKPSLPLTGGTGVALFVVVAVLLAGGAGVTFVRSRAVKRDLR